MQNRNPSVFAGTSSRTSSSSESEAVFGKLLTGNINTRALQAILTFHFSMSTRREINMIDSGKALRADRINQKLQIIPEHCPLLQTFSPAAQQK